MKQTHPVTQVCHAVRTLSLNCRRHGISLIGKPAILLPEFKFQGESHQRRIREPDASSSERGDKLIPEQLGVNVGLAGID